MYLQEVSDLLMSTLVPLFSGALGYNLTNYNLVLTFDVNGNGHQRRTPSKGSSATSVLTLYNNIALRALGRR